MSYLTQNLILWLIIAVSAWGYGWNIVKLIGADVLTGLEIARAIGIVVFPLGAVLGFF